jgi:7-carboxy-7-deazaguanine synthase
MWISELFYSIQGEGILSGVPSVFIRTSGCNLRCVWCDTPYTSWKAEGDHKSLDEIMEYVTQHSTGHVVLTGGEPMIAPETPELTRRLRLAGQHITIETAGTEYAEVECDLVSLSPKLAHSTPREGEWAERHENLRYRPEVLRKLMARSEYQLKFVVSSEADLAEIRSVTSELKANPNRVLLMPEGTDVATMNERGAWVSEICKREGFRFSPRLHVYLYGNRRGT